MAAGEPKIFGTPVTTCVYAVCLIHLLLCILIMSYLVVGHPLDLEGVIVSPVLQWIYGLFTMISITVIVCAGVGALYAIESHLNVYGIFLLISAVLDIFLFVVFLLWGRSCSRMHSDTPYHLVATLSCGLRDGAVLACLALLIVFKLVAVWVVNKCRRYVSTSTNQDLMPFLRKHLQSQMVEDDFQEMPPMPQTWMPSTAPLPYEPRTLAGPMMPMMPSMGLVARPVPTMMPMAPVASMGPPAQVRSSTPPPTIAWDLPATAVTSQIGSKAVTSQIGFMPLAPAVAVTSQVRSFTPPPVAQVVAPVATTLTSSVRSFTPPPAMRMVSRPVATAGPMVQLNMQESAQLFQRPVATSPVRTVVDGAIQFQPGAGYGSLNELNAS